MLVIMAIPYHNVPYSTADAIQRRKSIGAASEPEMDGFILNKAFGNHDAILVFKINAIVLKCPQVGLNIHGTIIAK